MPEPEQRVHHLSASDCRARLEGMAVGRVAWSSRRGPQILPVTFRLHDDTIVFRTDPYGPLATLQGGEPAVFEVDEFDPTTRCGWSVVVRGRAYADQRSPQADRLWREADPVPWAGGRRPMFVRITMSELTGRAVERPRTDLDEEDLVRR